MPKGRRWRAGVYTREPHEFTGEEPEFLEGLAGQAALALSRAETGKAGDPPKNEPPAADNRRGKSPQPLPGLYAALVSISPSQPVQETIAAITDKLVEATGADAAIVRVWKKETGASLVAAHRGLPDDAVKQMEVGLLGGAVERGRNTAKPSSRPTSARSRASRPRSSSNWAFALRSCCR